MEINNANLEQLSTLLHEMAGAEEGPRVKATAFLLEQAIDHAGYPKCLMELVKISQTPPELKLKAVLCLKAITKQWWFRQEGQPTKICEEDRNYIKDSVISVLCSTHPAVQPSLAQLVSDIADIDFPHNWPNMLPEIIARLGGEDFTAITGVLDTTNTVFLRYRNAAFSKDMHVELDTVCDVFGPPLTEFFKKAFSVQQSNSDPKVQKDIVKCLHMCICIFSSLIAMDLKDFFADNLSHWMEPMGILLRLHNPDLDNGSEINPGVVEEMKAEICDIVSLFSERELDDFVFIDENNARQPYLHKFVEIIWNLLTTTTTLARKFDVLVSKATAFMVQVANRAHTPHPFGSNDILNTIVRQLIIPNLGLREADIEMFEDEPEEYIRQDIEGNDMETRRRSATDLVRAFCNRFEEYGVSNSFKTYVGQLLEDYASDPATKWTQKDTALFVVIHMSAKTNLTSRGVTRVGDFVDVVEFYKQQIIPELAKSVGGTGGTHDIILAHCLKYAVTFRLQLSKDDIVALLPVASSLLGHSNYVVQTYAAVAIDRFFVIKENMTNKLRLTSDDMRPYTQQFLQALFKALTSQNKQNENMMKALLRVFTVARHEVAPLVPDLLEPMIVLIERVVKNQENPGFHYYLFMTISAMVRFSCESEAVRLQVEAKLFPYFHYFVEKDVSEFLPYAFQILSQLMAHQPDGHVSEGYQKILGSIKAEMWDRAGMVPGLTRLFKVFISKGGPQVASSTTMFLGVFQKLLMTRRTENEAFDIINEIMAKIPLSEVQVAQVFQLIVQRLAPKTKTKALAAGMLELTCHFAGRFGGDALYKTLQGIQQGLFDMLLQKVLIPQISETTPTPFTNTIAVGISKILSESPVKQQSILFRDVVRTMLGQKVVDDVEEDNDEKFVDVGVEEYQQSHVNLIFSENSVKRFPSVSSPVKIFAETVLTQVQANNQLGQEIGQEFLEMLVRSQNK